jgi:uncharacterized protein (DUF1778 family)
MAYKNKQDMYNNVNAYQKANYDRITVMAAKGKKAKYQAAAKLKNVSLSQFIMDCVDEKINDMSK